MSSVLTCKCLSCIRTTVNQGNIVFYIADFLLLDKEYFERKKVSEENETGNQREKEIKPRENEKLLFDNSSRKFNLFEIKFVKDDCKKEETYESIECFGPDHFDNPQHETKHENDHFYDKILDEGTPLVVCEDQMKIDEIVDKMMEIIGNIQSKNVTKHGYTEPSKCHNAKTSHSVKNEAILKKQIYENIIIALDKNADLICLTKECIKKYGEVMQQAWYYPYKTTHKQITLFLLSVKQLGTFVVYCPIAKDANDIANNFYLAVYYRKDVFHYTILETPTGNYKLSEDTVSFISIEDLIACYQYNRGKIVTRLRRPLKFSDKNVNFFVEYESLKAIQKEQVTFKNRSSASSENYLKYIGSYFSGEELLNVDIKTLANENLQENVDDLFYEACLLNYLKHHNIISLIGANFSKSPFFVVTENSHYGSLRSCIAREILPDFNCNNLKNVFIQILRGMCYLEESKCVHRKLSASAFYVTDKGFIKLSDFDKAILLKDKDDYIFGETNEEINVRISSPETLILSKYSLKSDVWACGILMWELYNRGKLMHESLSAAQIICQIVSDDFFLQRPPPCDEKSYELMSQCWNSLDYKRPTYKKLLNFFKNRQATNILNNNFKSLTSKESNSKLNTLKSNFQSSWKNTLDRRFAVGGVPTTLRKSIVSIDTKKFRKMAIRSKDALLKGGHKSSSVDTNLGKEKSQKSNERVEKSEISRSSDEVHEDAFSFTSHSIYMNINSNDICQKDIACSVPESGSYLQDRMQVEGSVADGNATNCVRPKSVEPFVADNRAWNLT